MFFQVPAENHKRKFTSWKVCRIEEHDIRLGAKEESPTVRPPVGDSLSVQFSAHARLGEDHPSVSGVAGGNTFRAPISTPYP